MTAQARLHLRRPSSRRLTAVRSAPMPDVSIEYEEAAGGKWFAHVADGDLRETLIGHDHGDAVRQAESWRGWRERLAREAEAATPA